MDELAVFHSITAIALVVSATAAVRTAASTAVEARQRMLAAAAVVRLGYDIAATIARFISLEVVELLGATARQRSTIAVVRVITVVHMAVEASRSVKPAAGSDEHTADKPIRSIVAVRRAIIRLIVKVTVWASRLPDPDNNL